MGYVVAAWLVTGLLLAGYGWSIRQRRRAVAAEAAAEAADDAARGSASRAAEDAKGAP